MRPAARRQSALRTPANDLLGTEANVRILRVLAGTDAPLGRAEIARRARLNASGVRRSIDSLTAAGIAETAGSPGRPLIRLRRTHPLAGILAALFDAEAERFRDLLDDLSSAMRELRPPPTAAWIEGRVAEGIDRPGDPVVLGVLAPAAVVDALAAQLENPVSDLSRQHDVWIDVRPYTGADLAAMREENPTAIGDVLLLFGTPQSVPVNAEAHPRHATGHARHDTRALALGRAIADRLAVDPGVVLSARAHIERRMERASGGERKELREWDRLLRNLSVAAIRRILVDPGERATRLRQSLPFLDALTPEKRLEILRESGRNQA